MTRKQFEQLMEVLGCCLLGICCPPGSPEQRAAFRQLSATFGVAEADADRLFAAALAKKP